MLFFPSRRPAYRDIRHRSAGVCFGFCVRRCRVSQRMKLSALSTTVPFPHNTSLCGAKYSNLNHPLWSPRGNDHYSPLFWCSRLNERPKTDRLWCLRLARPPCHISPHLFFCPHHRSCALPRDLRTWRVGRRVLVTSTPLAARFLGFPRVWTQPQAGSDGFGRRAASNLNPAVDI